MTNPAYRLGPTLFLHVPGGENAPGEAYLRLGRRDPLEPEALGREDDAGVAGAALCTTGPIEIRAAAVHTDTGVLFTRLAQDGVVRAQSLATAGRETSTSLVDSVDSKWGFKASVFGGENYTVSLGPKHAISVSTDGSLTTNLLKTDVETTLLGVKFLNGDLTVSSALKSKTIARSGALEAAGIVTLSSTAADAPLNAMLGKLKASSMAVSGAAAAFSTVAVLTTGLIDAANSDAAKTHAEMRVMAALMGLVSAAASAVGIYVLVKDKVPVLPGAGKSTIRLLPSGIELTVGETILKISASSITLNAMNVSTQTSNNDVSVFNPLMAGIAAMNVA